MILSFALAALQPASADVVEVPNCALITPGGDVARFFMSGDDDPGRVRLSALPDSVWPSGTVVGTREQASTALRFTLGGPDGLALQLGSQAAGRRHRSATLFSREDGRDTLPIAYGSCEDKPVAADSPEPGPDLNAIGAGIPAFDPARWPDGDCGLLLSDGRMTRLRFTLEPNDRVRLEGPGLWEGRPVAATVRWANATGAQVGTLSGDNGLSGAHFMFVSGARASRAIRLENLGDPMMADIAAYAICGSNNVVRRPQAQ